MTDLRELARDLRDENDALTHMSYHGTSAGWCADLGKDDVLSIRGFLLRAADTLERLAAEQEAAQAASQPCTCSGGINADGLFHDSSHCPRHAAQAASSEPEAESADQSGPEREPGSLLGGDSGGSRPTGVAPSGSLGAEADAAAQVKSALNELVDYAETDYTAAAEKAWVEGRCALDRLLAGKAAG